MKIAVVQINTGVLVKLAIKSAAPVAKVAATRMPVMMIMIAVNF